MLKIYANIKHVELLSATLLFFLFVLAVASLAIQEINPKDISIQPNQEIQSLLKGLISTNEQEMFSGTEKAFRQKLEQLRALAKTDTEMVSQLIYFSIYAKGMREAMLPGVIIEQMKIPDSTFAEVCLPLLDSKDESMRKTAANWLTRADHVSKGGVDFSRYESILREKKDNPPQGLIRYMYSRNPQAAVLSVAHVYGQDVPESEVAAKAKSGVKESVNYFSGRPEWWAHLYVATMMEKEPYLRTPGLMEKLETDTDPLVREKVTKLKQNQSPSK